MEQNEAYEDYIRGTTFARRHPQPLRMPDRDTPADEVVCSSPSSGCGLACGTQNGLRARHARRKEGSLRAQAEPHAAGASLCERAMASSAESALGGGGPCWSAAGDLPQSAARRLLQLLGGSEPLVTPCAHDALSARMIARAGFGAVFVSGFTAAAARGLPDTGLMSYVEMLDVAQSVVAALEGSGVPVICDADTGYGNALNTKRTIRGYAQAGVACIMLEDQVHPKRCGHAAGKAVVERDEALARIRAACDARREHGLDILILARTDARQTHGLEEALERCRLFRELGADITFLEAPESELEMQRYCDRVPGPKMANMLARGKTPALPPARLAALGFSLVAYPLDLLVAATQAMQATLDQLASGVGAPDFAPDAVELVWELSGFRAYQRDELRYAPRAAAAAHKSSSKKKAKKVWRSDDDDKIWRSDAEGE